jgi:hypothetical protein
MSVCKATVAADNLEISSAESTIQTAVRLASFKKRELCMPLEMMCIIIALYRSTKNICKQKEKKPKIFPEPLDFQCNVCGICFETRPTLIEITTTTF